jgi:S-DNA-T family DNA segregation ATPase FtsK/SpoIIIE
VNKLKDVFRKLVEFLGLDKPIEQPPIDEERVVERDVRQDIQVRTKVIYPSNRNSQVSSQFRFPIIPDEVQQPKKLIETETPNKVQTISVPKERRSESVPKDRKPFKPTEVVSPVYGRVQPHERKETDKKELQTFQKTPSIDQASVIETQQVIFKPSVQEKKNTDASKLHEIIHKEQALPKEAVNLRLADVPEKVVIQQESSVTQEEGVYATAVAKEEVASQPIQPSGQAKIIAFRARESLEPQEVVENEYQSTKSNEPFKHAELVPKETESHPMNENTFIETTATALLNEPTEQLRNNDNYQFPYLNYLKKEPPLSTGDDGFTEEQIEKLVVALESFNVKAEVIGVVQGPTVTRYELQPAPGVKVNKFTNLIDDIKLALAAKDIRMEAPIPGRSAIGIEVPNEISSPVFIRSVLESEEFITQTSPLAIALGRDISGAPVIGDLKKMPHGLIAGSTGSGKSVCVNSIIISLLYKAKPEDVRLILIDPKVVEMAPYNHIPHLLTPVVTDPKQATAALKWAVEEMDGRYEKFADTGARDIERYNSLALREGREKLPYIVIIIDELADLMMVSPHDVEESICRIAQKARACGIHLLVATQRPSVDVITGLIKANIPTRIAFSVSSQVDSRTILDMSGAERLLGKGDMLYYPSGMAKPVRLQGNFVSDDEIERVIDHVKAQRKTVYLFDKEDLTRATSSAAENDDELFEEALMFVIEHGQASSSLLQRRFRIGYNRAARLVDMMEAEGFISGQSGSKPRDVLISLEEYRNLMS